MSFYKGTGDETLVVLSMQQALSLTVPSPWNCLIFSWLYNHRKQTQRELSENWELYSTVQNACHALSSREATEETLLFISKASVRIRDSEKHLQTQAHWHSRQSDT